MRPKLERNHCIQLLEAGGVTARELPHAWWNISAKTCKLKFFREKKTRFSGVFGKKLHKSRFIVDFSKCSRQCHQGRQGGVLYWTINGMSWKKTEENQIYTWKWQCGKINFQNRKSLGPWERALASLKVVSCLLAPPSYFVCARGGMERQQKQIKMAAGLVPFQSPNKSCFFTLQVQGNSAKDNNHVFITFSTNGRKQTRTWCYVILFRPLECVFPAKKIEFFIEINWFEPVCLGRYTHTNLLLCLKPAWAWLLPIRAPLFFASPLPPSVVHSISRVFSHFTWLIGTTWRNPITLIRRKITFRKHTVFSSLLANVFKSVSSFVLVQPAQTGCNTWLLRSFGPTTFLDVLVFLVRGLPFPSCHVTLHKAAWMAGWKTSGDWLFRWRHDIFPKLIQTSTIHDFPFIRLRQKRILKSWLLQSFQLIIDDLLSLWIKIIVQWTLPVVTRRTKFVNCFSRKEIPVENLGMQAISSLSQNIAMLNGTVHLTPTARFQSKFLLDSRTSFLSRRKPTRIEKLETLLRYTHDYYF